MPYERGPEDRIVVEHLRRVLGERVIVYRFGSSASDTTHRASDIDLAVLAEMRLAPLARFDLQEDLAARVSRDVDLVDLRSASTVMAMQVVSTGVVLFDGDPVTRSVFEDLTFSQYARLNEERRGILERIAAEGTVYGG